MFVYVRSVTSWSLQQTINVNSNSFGYGLDIDAAGETIVIGSRDSSPSKIWIYTRSGTTWSQQREIDESGFDASDMFNSFGEVAINGDADTLIGAGWFVTVGGSGQAGEGIMKTYAT